MKRRVTREDIIRTTRDLIIRDGIRAVRVDEIAQKLEISKRTLYELFSDKDTLVGECWDKIREEQEKKIAGYLFYQPGSALEQAQNLIREYIDALCIISCISLQELQQKVSYADSYEKTVVSGWIHSPKCWNIASPTTVYCPMWTVPCSPNN